MYNNSGPHPIDFVYESLTLSLKHIKKGKKNIIMLIFLNRFIWPALNNARFPTAAKPW